MGWNGFNTNEKPAAVGRKKSKYGSWHFAVLASISAGGILIGILYFAFTFKTASDAHENRGFTKEKLISSPSQRSTGKIVSTQPPEDPHKGEVKVRGKWYPEYDEHGGKIWVTGYGVRYHTPTVRTNHFNQALISPERKIFENRADQDIAILLDIEPGTTFIGGFKFGKDFEEEFLKSLKIPIIPSQNDSPEVANLKRAVNEAKIDLKARYDDGENIVQIMNDTLDEFKKLSAYRDELLEVMRNAIREGKSSAEETASIYEAANKMLADRGIKPIRMPILLKNNLKLHADRNR